MYLNREKSSKQHQEVWLEDTNIGGEEIWVMCNREHQLSIQPSVARQYKYAHVSTLT